jgi:hypothetical protein
MPEEAFKILALALYDCLTFLMEKIYVKSILKFETNLFNERKLIFH